VQEALDIVHLSALAHRYPHELSGGQQQRVALARAIVFHPPLLLMDEPLGALDKKLRERMQIELVKIKNRLNITVIYVTHDQEEALVMSDRVVVMSNGVVQQIGSPGELYSRPANRFVADFIGEANILDGIVQGNGPVLAIAERTGLALRAVSNGSWSAGDRVAVVVRPEQIVIGEAARACGNCFEGALDQVIYVGDSSRYLISLSSGVRIIAKVQNGGNTRMPAAGERVPVGWDADRAWVLEGSEPVVPASLVSDDDEME
jgi:ABC-type Fe3+/spermidine/putrescine transport system ATPase subunit